MLLREHSLSPASSINLIICHKVSWPEQGYQELAVIQASAYLQSHGQGQEDAFSCSGASKHSVTFPFPSCISISGSFLENICLRHKRYRIGGRGWMHSNSSLLETSLWAENTIVMEKKKKRASLSQPLTLLTKRGCCRKPALSTSSSGSPFCF